MLKREKYAVCFCLVYNSRNWDKLCPEIIKFFAECSSFTFNRMILPQWDRGDYIHVIMETDRKNLKKTGKTAKIYWEEFFKKNPSEEQSDDGSSDSFFLNYPNNSILFVVNKFLYGDKNHLGQELRDVDTAFKNIATFASEMMLRFGSKYQVKNNFNRLVYAAYYIYSLINNFTDQSTSKAEIARQLHEACLPKELDYETTRNLEDKLADDTQKYAAAFEQNLKILIKNNLSFNDNVNFKLKNGSELKFLNNIFGIYNYEELLITRLLNLFFERCFVSNVNC